MKHCLACRAVYDDGQKFCDVDGSPLLSSTSLAADSQSQRVKKSAVRAGLVGSAVVILIAALAVGFLYTFDQPSAPQAPEATPTASPDTREQAQQPAGDPAPPPAVGSPVYFVIGLTSREQSDAVREMERRNQTGYQTHVEYSSDWSNLAPGYYVVVYKTSDTEAEASAAANELKSRGIQAYVKYSGSPNTDGAVVTAEQEAGGREADPGNAASPAARPAAVGESGAAGEESINEVMRLWEQHFTRCGDSYVSLGPGNTLRQLRDVGFVISRRNPLTKADERNGFEWSGKVMAVWNVWRRANRQDSGWVWGEWKDTPQSVTFDVTKRNSRWKVLNSLYDQKKVECPDLP